MKAIVRYRYGSPNVLELREINKPAVKDGAVLVRVRAASVNSGDLDYLYGRPLIARIGTGLRRPKYRGLVFPAVVAASPGTYTFPCRQRSINRCPRHRWHTMNQLPGRNV